MSRAKTFQEVTDEALKTLDNMIAVRNCGEDWPYIRPLVESTIRGMLYDLTKSIPDDGMMDLGLKYDD